MDGEFYKNLTSTLKEIIELSNEKIAFPKELTEIDLLQKYSLNAWQNDILFFIYDYGAQKMSAIAEYLHLQPTNTTTIVNDMVCKGIVYKTKGTSDKRVVFVNLTDQGVLLASERRNRKIKYIEERLNSVLSENDRQKFFDSALFIKNTLEKF